MEPVMCHQAYDDGYRAFTESRRLIAERQRRLNHRLLLMVLYAGIIGLLLWAALAPPPAWLWNASQRTSPTQSTA
jgi:hypothetical protein